MHDRPPGPRVALLQTALYGRDPYGYFAACQRRYGSRLRPTSSQPERSVLRGVTMGPERGVEMRLVERLASSQRGRPEAAQRSRSATLSEGTEVFDVAVIGAGLAGLTAATALQRAGHRTVVLERRSVAGGLCGNFEHDGLTFPVACNEFGRGLFRELAALGACVPRRATASHVHLGQRRLRLPPDATTIVRLLAASGGLARVVRAARDGSARTLADAIDRARPTPDLVDLAGVLAYTAGVPMRYLRLADLAELLAGGHGYGLHDLGKPIGGPGAITEALVERYVLLGGRLWL
jgi:hypothetical protein